MSEIGVICKATVGLARLNRPGLVQVNQEGFYVDSGPKRGPFSLRQRRGIFRQSMHESGLLSNRQLLVHVVKGEETLTSFSKKYGVSMYAIAAANFDIVDLDLVMEGQRLYIPIRVQKNMMVTSYAGKWQKYVIEYKHNALLSVSKSLKESKQIYRRRLDKYRSFLNAHLISESQKFISTVTSYSPPTTGKWTGYYLFFFPTLAFCIIYMLKASQARDHKLLKQQRVEKSNVSQARNSRWRKILDDEAVTDPCDTSTEEIPQRKTKNYLLKRCVLLTPN